ncbi:MAG: glycosyltransferase [Propionibacteriales bacterium]|nr:glycosyltransferase [Propionibacteriales bacterium]
MRVLMLSWEYPPLIYGGLARHVQALSTALAGVGHEVVVATQTTEDTPADQVVDGVRVLRVRQEPPLVPRDDLFAWTMSLDHALTRGALTALGGWRPDVVHAHDWLVAHAAATVRTVYDVPLVATIHATEAGRWNGWLPEPMNRAIHSVEWWLTYLADRVICCSGYVAHECGTLFATPGPKLEVIPNGVDLATWTVSGAERARARSEWGGHGPLVVFTGRLEYEKGVQTLLAAMPRLRRRHPGIRLLVAGRGSHEAALRAEARRLRLGRSIRFAGWLDDTELPPLVAAADVVAVPSLYEPFGLVALEAAAAGTPVVASQRGGLAEIIKDHETGLLVDAGSPADWADAIDRIVTEPDLGAGLAVLARAQASESFRWESVAAATVRAYERAATIEAPQPRPDFVVREGNQFTLAAEPASDADHDDRR